MIIKWPLLLMGILLSLKSMADGYLPALAPVDQPWSITASFGNSRYTHIDSRDKHSAVGRLAVGNELLLTGDYALGLEMGFQNGNHIQINIPKETLNVLGWLPVNTTIRPMLDLLITAKSDPLGGSAFFAQLKGGVAYRYWQLKNEAEQDLTRLAGEIQAGFGYPITALANLSLLYQGIYGNDPHYRVITYNQSGHITNIPALHAILLGFSVNL